VGFPLKGFPLTRDSLYKEFSLICDVHLQGIACIRGFPAIRDFALYGISLYKELTVIRDLHL